MESFPVRRKIRLPLSVYRQDNAFFVTIATPKKHPWFRLHPNLCETAIQELRVSAATCGITIYAWCIMPGHIHMLLQGSRIVDFIRLFKGRLTPRAHDIEPMRKLWQRSFYDHALRKEESLSDIACYIWENPVRAAIVENPIEYPWSGSEVWPEWRGFYGRG